MPSYDKAVYAEQMKARTKELTDKLETGMKNLYDGDKYKSYLNSMSKFHNYSTKNIMLIHQQMPDASRIASYKTWKDKLSRQVKGGETGLYIYAPAKQKDPEKVMMEKLDPETGAPLLDRNGKVIMEEMTPLSALDSIKFVLVPVFDISQTTGEPLPELAENITGNVAHYEAFIDALKDVSPLPIVFEPMNESQDGYCRYGEKIGIRENMSETQTVSAIVHEMTHDKLHDKEKLPDNAEPKKKRVKEIEAESVSYVVCQHYGIETSPNSFGYLAEYGSRDMSELKASLDTIRKEAGSLITAIDERFIAICQERGIDLTAKEPERAAEPTVQAEPSYTTESRTENIAGVDFEFQDIMPEAAKRSRTVEEINYEKFSAIFPQVASGEYSYLRLEAGGGYEPLSLEWIDTDKISIMHTYTQNGDLCYDPMMVFEVNKEAGTLNAVEFEQSIPPLYQVVDENGSGRSIDGNGNEQTLQNLQMSLNGFASGWFDNIDSVKEYMPVRATAEINGEDTRITFDEGGKPVLPETENDNSPPTVDNELSDMPDIIMPDPSIGYSEMNLYGYNADDILPLTTDRAIDLFNQDLTVYLLFNDNTESMVYDSSEIQDHDGIFGIDREEWQNSKEYKVAVEYTADTTKYSEAAVESDFIYSKEDKYAIYQIKDDAEMARNYRFEGLDYLKKRNWEVNRNNYVLVYTAPLAPSDTLENIYLAINHIKPQDFPGHSPSVSDIIVLNKGGDITSHYIDRFGFAELPDFLGVEKQADIDFKELPTQPETPKNEQPIYPYSADIALQNGEIDAFHASRQINIECGQAIDKAISDSNTELYHYDLKTAVKSVIEEYGADRVAWVLAGNINYHNWDGRLSDTNKAWAKEFDTPKPDVYLKTHLAILDGFSNRFREAEKEKPSLLDTLNKTEQKIKRQKPDTAIDGKDKPKKSNREDI